MAESSDQTQSPSIEGKKSIVGGDCRGGNGEKSLSFSKNISKNDSSQLNHIEKANSPGEKRSNKTIDFSCEKQETHHGETRDELWSLVTTKCEHLKNFSKLCSYKQAQMDTSRTTVCSQSEGACGSNLSTKPKKDHFHIPFEGASPQQKKSDQSDTFSDSDPDLTVAKVLGNLLSSVNSSHIQRTDFEPISSSPSFETCCEIFNPHLLESPDCNEFNCQKTTQGISDFPEPWNSKPHCREPSQLGKNLNCRHVRICEPFSEGKKKKQREYCGYDRYGLSCCNRDGDKRSSKFQNWKAAGIALKKALSVESSKQANHQNLCSLCRNNRDLNSLSSLKIPKQEKKGITESFDIDPMNAMLNEYTMKHGSAKEDPEHDRSEDAQKCSCGQNIKGDITTQIDTSKKRDTVSVKDRILQLTANLMDTHSSTSKSLKKSRTKMCHRKSKPVSQNSSVVVLDESSSDSDDSIIQPKRHKCLLKTKSTADEILLKTKYVSSERARRMRSRKKEIFTEKERSLHLDKKNSDSKQKSSSSTEHAKLLESSSEDELSHRLSDILSKDVDTESQKKNTVAGNSSANCLFVSGKSDRDFGFPKLSGSDSFSSDNDSTPIAACKLSQRQPGNLNLTRSATYAKRRLLLESDSLVNLADVESDSSTNGSSTLEESDSAIPVPQESWEQLNNEQNDFDEDEPMSVDLTNSKIIESDDRDFSGSENDCQEDFEEFIDIPDISTSPRSDEEQEEIELIQEGLQELEEEEENSELCFSSGSDNDAEADDEFECDCEVCVRTMTELGLGPRDRKESDERAGNAFLPNLEEQTAHYPREFNMQLSLGLDSDELNGETGDLDGDQIPFSITIDELRPLGLFLMSDRRQDLLDIMFQNVISQMLEVYPDLLGDQAPPPASVLTIEALPVIKIDIETITDDHICPICLCKFDVQEEAKQLPCQHIFHTLCIQAWLNKSGTCPVCRQVLDTDG